MSETFERKLSALKTLVDMMPKVPEMRRDVSRRTNVRWLIRNMGIREVLPGWEPYVSKRKEVQENADHPLYATTIEQLIWAEKNWEE